MRRNTGKIKIYDLMGGIPFIGFTGIMYP